MRILSIIHNTQPGGVQRVAIMETSWINTTTEKKGLLASIQYTYEWSLFQKKNIKPIYILKKELSSRILAGLIVGRLANVKCDAIIAHNLPSFQVALKIKQKTRKDIPILFYLHDSLTYPIPGSIYGETYKIFPSLLRKVENDFIKKAKITIINSNVTYDKIKKVHKIQKRKLKILYPTMNYPLTTRELIEKKKKYLLIVGRMDHEAFFNLYVILKKYNVNLPIIIAGYGHPRSKIFLKIIKLFKTLKDARKIHFVFYPSDQQLLELYRYTSLFIYPGHENFNMSALEAMSAGAPILIADSSGLCDLLPSELRAYVCLPKNNLSIWVDRITEITNGKSYTIGKMCWEVTKEYNINTHMQHFSNILEEVL